MSSKYSVYHFLEKDLLDQNKNNKDNIWWVSTFGGIEQMFDIYYKWEFYLEKSKHKYSIKKHEPKSFWQKVWSLFKHEESYYEISVDFKEEH